MKPELPNTEFDSPVGEHELSVDRVVTTAMYGIAESLGRGRIFTLISGCRKGAIDSMLAAKPELAAVFIHLGAELIATAEDGVVIESERNAPSKAIALLSSLA
ncbi:MAG: hypothetical protein ABTQ26_12265 [Azonexus sp.]